MTETASDTTARYPVRLVATRTGLSPHLLRAWERRYGVVTPSRSEGGQRLYSELDIERLGRLRRLVERGHAIGRIASLPLEELARLETESATGAPEVGAAAGYDEDARDRRVREFNDAAMRAIRQLDAAALQEVLERAAVGLGVPEFLEGVAGPTLEDIGHGWAERSVSVAQEHMATAVFRRLLGWLLGMYPNRSAAHRLVVATPPGERHELGALMAAITAAAEGWGVTYLGPDLPVDEVLEAVGQTGAEAVALSIVRPGDARGIVAALRELRAALPSEVALLLGGAGDRTIGPELEPAGVTPIDSLAELRPALRRLAAPGV
jgi:DNA-binding transcriptional MerR regulator/methylmalonyl-CoA mutase cobalamin-binding subunit